MTRFLTIATAVALGLASCGITKAGGCTDRHDRARNDRARNDRAQNDRERFEPYRNAESDWEPGAFYRWWLPRNSDGLPSFDDWWSHPDELRHFDHFDFLRSLTAAFHPGAAETVKP